MPTDTGTESLLQIIESVPNAAATNVRKSNGDQPG